MRLGKILLIKIQRADNPFVGGIQRQPWSFHLQTSYNAKGISDLKVFTALFFPACLLQRFLLLKQLLGDGISDVSLVFFSHKLPIPSHPTPFFPAGFTKFVSDGAMNKNIPLLKFTTYTVLSRNYTMVISNILHEL